ncbi:MarR family transcriptional regulator [Salipaludibacillus sp. CUR1]|uniref:MarR family transcriptional regulator n=1 Tax=Salipaludibacillus sp. CUR1 TaxID=2820003 RepID=UPI001E2886B4|nr:helix-turn-helix domain-containing protein [Salipaludibacillus sp. CUR1]MCE7793450.1 MarR family transcriptional regulator [Salipaludibacillus sp. CUR1]
MSREYIDRETGEIKEFTQTRTKEQQEVIENEKRKKAYRDAQGAEKHPFYFAKMEKAKEADNMLSMKDKGYFAVIQCYISYDNMLKKENDSKLPMTRKDLLEVLKIKKYDTVSSLINKFKKHGLIEEKKIDLYGKQYKALFVNDEYCFRKDVNKGKSTKKTAKVFMNNVKELYAEDKIKPADLGFVYSIIPLVNYHHNLLTANPYEPDASKDQYLTVNDITEVTGLHSKEVAKKVSSLRWNGMSVFVRIKRGRETIIKVNPLIVYRQEGYPPFNMYAEFIINKK